MRTARTKSIEVGHLARVRLDGKDGKDVRLYATEVRDGSRLGTLRDASARR